jgi:DNA-binding transcriptional LysR family regulator
LGIIVEPDFQIGPEVRAGRLVRILGAFELAPVPMYVVYPSRRHLSAKVRAFAEFLSERFARSEWALDEAAASGRKATIARRPA